MPAMIDLYRTREPGEREKDRRRSEDGQRTGCAGHEGPGSPGGGVIVLKNKIKNFKKSRTGRTKIAEDIRLQKNGR